MQPNLLPLKMKLQLLALVILMCVGAGTMDTTSTQQSPTTTHTNDKNTSEDWVSLPWSLVYAATVMLVTTALLHVAIFCQVLVYIFRNCSKPSGDDSGNYITDLGFGNVNRRKPRDMPTEDATNATLQLRGNRRSVRFNEDEDHSGQESGSFRKWSPSCNKFGTSVCRGRKRRGSVPADYTFRRTDTITKSPLRPSKSKHNSDSQLHNLLPIITVVPPCESETDMSPQETGLICAPSNQLLSPRTLYSSQVFVHEEAEGEDIFPPEEQNAAEVGRADAAYINRGLYIPEDKMEVLDVPSFNAPRVPQSDDDDDDDDEFLVPRRLSLPRVSFATEHRDSIESFNYIPAISPDLPYDELVCHIRGSCVADDSVRKQGTRLHGAEYQTSIEVSVPEESNTQRGIFNFIDSCESEGHTLEMWEVPDRFSGSSGVVRGATYTPGASLACRPRCRYSSYETSEMCRPRPPRVRRYSVQDEGGEKSEAKDTNTVVGTSV